MGGRRGSNPAGDRRVAAGGARDRHSRGDRWIDALVGAVVRGPEGRTALAALNLRGFGGLALAQVASFAVVLAIGALGGGSPHHQAPAGGVRLGVTVLAGQGSEPGATAGSRTGQRSPRSARSPFLGRRVAVLAVSSPATVASGRLNSAGQMVAKVSEGSYVVCVNPPREWTAARPAAALMPGWTCAGVVVGHRPARLTLTLVTQAAQAAQAHGGTR